MLFLYDRIQIDAFNIDFDFPNPGDIARTIGGLLCRFIYELIVNLYNLFINIAQVSFIKQGDLNLIYRKITLILTMVMVFYVTFETVKYVIQPDTMTDKERGAGKIVTKMILVVLLIAMVPTIFEYSRKLQKGILDSNLISNIFLNTQSQNPADAGKNFSADLLSVFYAEKHPGTDSGCNIPDRGASPVRDCPERVRENLQSLRQNGTIPYLGRGLWEYNGSNTSDYKIKFDWLLAALVGAFIVYILMLYCIDAGVRVAQLAFLEIIAPIPIIGYLSPKKDGMFEKWVKQCITTYIDLFIRMMILYVVFLIANMLGSAYGNGTGRLFDGLNPAPSSTMKVFIYIALILGLFLFAQKAPKLLQELLPKGSSAAAGNFGLKGKERIAPLAAKAIGAGAAGTRTLTGGLIRRAAWRHARNKANNRHSIFTPEGREERKRDKKHREELRKARKRSGNHAADQAMKQEFDNAREAWTKKHQEGTKAIREQMKAAKERGDTAELNRLGQQLRAKNKELENSDEYRRWNVARENMRGSSTISYTRSERNIAQENLRKAQAESTMAHLSGNQKRIKEAEKKEAEAKKAYEAAKKQYSEDGKGLINGNQEEIAQELAQKEEMAHEQTLKDKNEHYQSYGGAFAGAVGASVKAAATTAVKIKKVDDISTNVKQAVKDDINSVHAVQKYYDEGGTGFVDRTIQQVEKKIGMPTAYERTVLETRAKESEIKPLEAQSALIKDVKTSTDGAEDRLKSKIEDLKLNTSGGIKTGLKDAAGNDILTTPADGATIGDVYRTYKGRAESAKAESESAAAALQKFETENAEILSKDPSTLLTQAEKDEFDKKKAERNVLAQTKEQKAKASTDAAYAVTQVQKNAARYEYTEILREFASGKTASQISASGKYDGPAVEQVADALESLKVARSNTTIVEDLRTRLSTEHYNQFMSGKIMDFDVLDEIKTKALSAQAEYDRRTRLLKEQKRSIETSRETQAQKAANDYNGSGGSK